MICWFHEKAMVLGGKYSLKHTTNDLRCVIRDVKYKIDVNTLEHNNEDKKVGLNDIAKITIKTTKPLYFDSYRKNRKMGSVILIDEATNNTVAAGMIM
jgi:sulfate adenylyltransferase subunit 1